MLADQEHPADAVLRRLSELLNQERVALRALDRDAIERFAADKLELDGQLGAAVESRPLLERHRPLLESIRRDALTNQLLLVHARSCVQGILSMFAPKTNPGYRAGRRAPGHHSSDPPPMALNLRR